MTIAHYTVHVWKDKQKPVFTYMFDHISKHLKAHQIYYAMHHIYFQLSSWCLENVVKHSLLCLI